MHSGLGQEHGLPPTLEGCSAHVANDCLGLIIIDVRPLIKHNALTNHVIVISSHIALTFR